MDDWVHVTEPLPKKRGRFGVVGTVVRATETTVRATVKAYDMGCMLYKIWTIYQLLRMVL